MEKIVIEGFDRYTILLALLLALWKIIELIIWVFPRWISNIKRTRKAWIDLREAYRRR